MRADNPNRIYLSDPWLEPDDDSLWCDNCEQSGYTDCYCDEDDNDEV